jgi:hypothetical protein
LTICGTAARRTSEIWRDRNYPKEIRTSKIINDQASMNFQASSEFLDVVVRPPAFDAPSRDSDEA